MTAVNKDVASTFSHMLHSWNTHCRSSCCRMFGNVGGRSMMA